MPANYFCCVVHCNLHGGTAVSNMRAISFGVFVGCFRVSNANSEGRHSVINHDPCMQHVFVKAKAVHSNHRQGSPPEPPVVHSAGLYEKLDEGE